MALTRTDKFCVDCVHCFERPRVLSHSVTFECQHPKALSRLLVDPVTGQRFLSRVLCDDERANTKDAAACGPEGYHFERKNEKS